MHLSAVSSVKLCSCPYITTNGKPGTPDIWRKHAWIYFMSDMGSLIKKKKRGLGI
jgi:hypothetical protein